MKPESIVKLALEHYPPLPLLSYKNSIRKGNSSARKLDKLRQTKGTREAMKSNQEKFVTAVVLTLTIALFSTNFLKGEEQVQVEQDFDTVITTHVQNL